MRARRDPTRPDADALRSHLKVLNLAFMPEHYQAAAQTAADKHWSHRSKD